MEYKNKILHLTFDMRIGGTEQVIKNLVEATDLSKFEVSILCIENPIGPFGNLLMEQGFKIDSFQRMQGFDLKLIENIRSYIKKNKIDVLHCHQYTPYVYGVLSSLFLGINVIFTEHGRFYPDKKSWKRSLANPILNLFTNSVTAISMATAKALVIFENFPSKKVKVVYNGIKLKKNIEIEQTGIAELKKELGLSNSTFVIGTIARLDPIKNHKMLISAFAHISNSDNDITLLIIGDGQMKNELKELAISLNIENRVIFTGFIVKPQKYLSVMDIFTLPSYSEGTSMTLLESMMYKKPAIVTNVGGSPEIVIDGETGIVIENDNLKSLIQAIMSLKDSRELRLKLGESAYSRYTRHFTSDDMICKYERLYGGVVKRNDS